MSPFDQYEYDVYKNVWSETPQIVQLSNIHH